MSVQETFRDARTLSILGCPHEKPLDLLIRRVFQDVLAIRITKCLVLLGLIMKGVESSLTTVQTGQHSAPFCLRRKREAINHRAGAHATGQNNFVEQWFCF
ncbi:hypothetical protein RRG08_036808 [Elysia crispata]|uniref:Uncharacterized protein n=1 Tax=Elysia crispata TaxID=231223 RepID=A0AAE1ACU6_9GAST|nr:hypothetical protein RRG08_036808 [Elysia crispata]